MKAVASIAILMCACCIPALVSCAPRPRPDRYREQRAIIESVARVGAPVDSVVARLGDPDTVTSRVDGSEGYVYASMFMPRLRGDDFAGAIVNVREGKVIGWDEVLGPTARKPQGH